MGKKKLPLSFNADNSKYKPEYFYLLNVKDTVLAKIKVTLKTSAHATWDSLFVFYFQGKEELEVEFVLETMWVKPIIIIATWSNALVQENLL